MRLMGCDLGSSAGTLQGFELELTSPRTDYLLPLPEDRHALWLPEVEDRTPERSATLELSYVTGALTDICSAAVPLRIDSGRSLTLVLAGERPARYVSWAGEGTSALRLTTDASDGLTVEACRGCDSTAAPQCSPLEFSLEPVLGRTAELPASTEPAWLRISASLGPGQVRRLVLTPL